MAHMHMPILSDSQVTLRLDGVINNATQIPIPGRSPKKEESHGNDHPAIAPGSSG
jgi:hypothetical protein